MSFKMKMQTSAKDIIKAMQVLNDTSDNPENIQKYICETIKKNIKTSNSQLLQEETLDDGSVVLTLKVL